MANGITARNAKEITPSDSATLEVGVVAIFTGTGGNLEVENDDGTACTIVTVDGQLLPFRPNKIKSTGTTATGIVAFSGIT